MIGGYILTAQEGYFSWELSDYFYIVWKNVYQFYSILFSLYALYKLKKQQGAAIAECKIADHKIQS